MLELQLQLRFQWKLPEPWRVRQLRPHSYSKKEMSTPKFPKLFLILRRKQVKKLRNLRSQKRIHFCKLQFLTHFSINKLCNSQCICKCHLQLHIIHGWWEPHIHKPWQWWALLQIIWARRNLLSVMVQIPQTFMQPWIIGTKIHIQFQLHSSLLLNLAVYKTQEKIGHTKVQKDQIQLITNNIICQVRFQITMGGIRIPFRSNWRHRVMLSTRKIKNGRRTSLLVQTQPITNNTTSATQVQTSKLIQATIFLL